MKKKRFLACFLCAVVLLFSGCSSKEELNALYDNDQKIASGGAMTAKRSSRQVAKSQRYHDRHRRDLDVFSK